MSKRTDRSSVSCLVSVVLCGLITGCGSKTDRPAESKPAETTPLQGISPARAVVESVRERFRVRAELPDVEGVEVEQDRPVLGEAIADRIDRDGAWLKPHIPDAKAKVIHPARVTLPTKANGAFELRDKDSGMWIEVALEGAEDVEGETADGYVVYRGGYRGGASVIHRPSAEGTEDYIVFEEAPEEPEIRYTVRLGDKVAGLRLVENVLEFLDEGGAPRLRMGAPSCTDRDGEYACASVAVGGANVDISPRAPWRRTVYITGTTSFTVRLLLQAGSGPFALDPSWTSAGSPHGYHESHTATALDSGVVVVAGGPQSAGSKLVDLFDPVTKTWAVGASMNSAREEHAADRISPTKVLVVGGRNGYGDSTMNGEIYDESTGTWTLTSATSVWHDIGFPVVALADGRAIVVGGSWSGSDKVAEVYDPSNDLWTEVNPSTRRWAMPAVRLLDGRVLVCGGFSGASPVASCDAFDPNGDTWQSVAPMLEPRNRHLAVRLNDGRVLVSGGYQTSAPPEVFDPNTNTWTATGPVVRRHYHAMVTLLSGKILVAGGRDPSLVTLESAEVFVPESGSWESLPDMATPRMWLTATLLPSGEALVGGGNGTTSSRSFELFGLLPGSGACALDGECLSGQCQDGICCDIPCTNACYACSTARKGYGVNGICEPVQSGLDPNGDCADTGSPTCQQNGLCDGIGACQLYPTQSACTPEACHADTECASGHCADGVCCDTACSATCMACTAAKKGAGIDGICGPVAADTDPNNNCPIDALYPQSCKADGTCDGAGQCRPYAHAGVSCDGTIGQCENGIVISAAECNGAGTCLGKPKSCEPYVCADNTGCATSCTTDAQCVAAAWCQTSDGTCQPDRGNGDSCSLASQCLSNNCVDGICCDAPCDGTCMSCRAAHQLSGGQDGHCAAVKEGIDPYGVCPEDGTTSCKRDGQCNGLGGCRFYVAGSACGPTQCVGNDVKGQICDGLGNCGYEANGVACAPYVCSGNTCANPCSSDLQCSTGFWCDAGVCREKGAPGAFCTAPNQCAQGFCADGVCCNVPCDDVCSACLATLKQSGDGTGTCGPAKAATDPHDDCPADGQQTCLRDGECDGFGACRQYAQGTPCGDSQCVKDSFKAKVCNGHGLCELEAAAESCGAYTCIAGSCMTSCAEDSDCATNYYCDTSSGACTGKFAAGKPCTDGLQCQSGNCADEVCCDTECNGQCEYCALPGVEGTCTPVLGDPKPGHPACKGKPGEICTGSCDGAYRAECAYPQAGTRCASMCTEGAETSSVCDGDGSCKLGATKTCDPYVCGADKCKTSCTSNADCSAGNACGPDSTCGPNLATCDGDHTLITTSGATVDCAPYKCQTGGSCRDTCESSADCVSPALCDRTGHCVPPGAAEAATDDGGCGCSVPSGRGTKVPVLVSVLAGLAWWMRKRRAGR